MFGWVKKERDPKGQKDRQPGPQIYGIPTVKFDAAKVTEAVKFDLRKNIQSLKEIGAGDFDKIYEAARLCVPVRELHYSSNRLLLMIANQNIGYLEEARYS